MINKKIVFTKPNVAELLTEQVPDVGDKAVLVRLVNSTISSGTERANLAGNPYVTWFDTSGIAKFPRITGYSSSGIVEKTGSGVKSVVPGDRVALYWSVHAKYNVLPEKNVVKIPDDVSFADGALLHISTFPMAAIRKCRHDCRLQTYRIRKTVAFGHGGGTAFARRSAGGVRQTA